MSSSIRPRRRDRPPSWTGEWWGGAFVLVATVGLCRTGATTLAARTRPPPTGSAVSWMVVGRVYEAALGVVAAALRPLPFGDDAGRGELAERAIDGVGGLLLQPPGEDDSSGHPLPGGLAVTQ